MSPCTDPEEWPEVGRVEPESFPTTHLPPSIADQMHRSLAWMYAVLMSEPMHGFSQDSAW